MEITEFAVKILILFLPGIICTYLDDKNTNVKELSIVVTVVKSIIYSMISYLILGLFYKLEYLLILRYQYSRANIVHFFEFFNYSSNNIDIEEVFIVSLIAIIISAFKTSYINITEECNTLAFNQKRNDKNLNWFVKKVLEFNSILKDFKISKDGIGNNDVWNYVLTNQQRYITVRDWDNNFTYKGRTTINSSFNKNGELYLENVLVIDMEGIEEDKCVTSVYLNKNDSSSWDITFHSELESSFLETYIKNKISENEENIRMNFNSMKNNNISNINNINNINSNNDNIFGKKIKNPFKNLFKKIKIFEKWR